MTDTYIVYWKRPHGRGFEVSRVDDEDPESAAHKAVEHHSGIDGIEADGVEVGVAEEKLHRFDVPL